MHFAGKAPPVRGDREMSSDLDNKLGIGAIKSLLLYVKRHKKSNNQPLGRKGRHGNVIIIKITVKAPSLF